MVRKGFERRGGGVFCTQVFQNSPVPPAGPERNGVGRARRSSGGGPGSALPRTRPTAGAPQGWEGRAPAEAGNVHATGAIDLLRPGRPTHPAGRPLAGGVLEGPLVLRGDAGRSAVRAGSVHGAEDLVRGRSGRCRSGSGVRTQHVGVRSGRCNDRWGRHRAERRGRRATPCGFAEVSRSSGGGFADAWNVNDDADPAPARYPARGGQRNVTRSVTLNVPPDERFPESVHG